MQAQVRGRDLIIETAIHLFAEQGFEKTTMEDIVKKAKVSKGLILYHFGGMDGVLAETIRQVVTCMEALMPQESKANPPKKWLEQFLDNYIASLQRDIALWKLYSVLCLQEATRKQVMGLGVARFFEKYLEKLNELFGIMGFAESSLQAEWFDTFRRGMLWGVLADGERYPLEQMKKQVLKHVLQLPD